jgi:hypothetical protein
MKFAIIVGHSEDAQGAFAGSPINAHEYEWNSELAVDIWRECRELGLDVQVFSRNQSTVKAVGEAVTKFCGENGCAVELHFNAATETSARGTETLYDIDPPLSKDFAKLVHANILRALQEEDAKGNLVKRKDRGLKLVSAGDRGNSNLFHVKCPSCLIEPFFGSNQKDCELARRNRMNIVKAISHSAIEWLRLYSKPA